jgi:hypothetical protein
MIFSSGLGTFHARTLVQYSSSGNDTLKYKRFDIHRCALYRRRFVSFVEVACRIYPREHAYEDIYDALRQIVLGLPCRTSFNDCLAQPCEGSFIHSLSKPERPDKAVGCLLKLLRCPLLTLTRHGYGTKSIALAGTLPLISTSSDFIAYPRPFESRR